MNKRDKKRQVIADRLTDIVNNFAEKRDVFYGQRLLSLTADMNHINNAQLYDNKALEESDYDITDNQQPDASLLAGASGGQGVRVQPRQRLGKHAAAFVQDVNDALEDKDAELTRLAVSHPHIPACTKFNLAQDNFNFFVDQLTKDYGFNMAVAEEEHKRLIETLRQRLIANVQNKKTALQRDKEKLDIADTNALLYHPNQFSMNNAASPGGPQGNRKTRHTRHRLEVDDIDPAIAINGKRKRKLANDGDTGSPVREPDFLNGYKFPDPRPEEAMSQSYTVDKLFTDKELNAHLQAASLKVLANQQASKRRKLGNAPGLLVADASELEDNAEEDAAEEGEVANGDGYLEAPGMERSATNQSYHATRSTRTTNPLNGANRENLGELAGRQAAAELIGTFHREKKKEEDYNRAAPLSADGVEHDFALIAKAIEVEDAERVVDTSLLEEVAGERPDYVQLPEMATDEANLVLV